MPKGSKYPGDPERLGAYADLVARHGDAELRGAKNPYTSRNGWMTSFLDPDGRICLRLSGSDRSELIAAGGTEVEQYGRNMPDFAGMPASAAEDELDAWFTRSWEHTGTLDPK